MLRVAAEPQSMDRSSSKRCVDCVDTLFPCTNTQSHLGPGLHLSHPQSFNKILQWKRSQKSSETQPTPGTMSQAVSIITAPDFIQGAFWSNSRFSSHASGRLFIQVILGWLTRSRTRCGSLKAFETRPFRQGPPCSVAATFIRFWATCMCPCLKNMRSSQRMPQRLSLADFAWVSWVSFFPSLVFLAWQLIWATSLLYSDPARPSVT